MWNRPEDPDRQSGDDGMTYLGTGEHVPKTHSRMIAVGDLEELDCHLGLLCYETQDAEVILELAWMSGVINYMAVEFQNPDVELVTTEHVQSLESAIVRVMKGREYPTEPLIISDTSKDALKFRLAGTICRRAERNVMRVRNYSENVTFNDNTLAFLNRLSDFLFALTL